MPVIFSMIEFRWFRAGRRISARQNGSWNAAAWSSASRHPAFRNCGSLGCVLGGSWPLASLPLPEVVERKEALVGVEPTVADLQSAALATWLQRLKYRAACTLADDREAVDGGRRQRPV